MVGTQQRASCGGGNGVNFNQKHPCSECPFRADSIRGWLGEDDDPEKLINAVLGLVPIGEGTFIGKDPEDFDCHMSTAKVLEAAGLEDLPPELEGAVEHCVGALLMLKSRCKRPHDRAKSFAMDKASENAPMLKTREAFIKHHSL